MTHQHRRAIALTFILGFFVSAPLLLLYAGGLHYNKKRGVLQGTGAITVESEPKGAHIYLNGVLGKDMSPARIVSLLPNVYHLEIEKEGYTRWVMDIEVRAGENALTQARLFPKSASLLPLAGLEKGHTLAWSDPSSGWCIVHDEARSLLTVFNAGKGERLSIPVTPDFRLVDALASDDKDSLAWVAVLRGRTRAFLVSVPLFGRPQLAEGEPPPGTGKLYWEEGGSAVWFAGDFGVARTSADLRAGGIQSLSPKSLWVDREGWAWTVETVQKGTPYNSLRTRPVDDMDAVKEIALLNADDYDFVAGAPEGYVTLLSSARNSLMLIRHAEPVQQETAVGIKGAHWFAQRYLYLWNDYELSLWDAERAASPQNEMISFQPLVVTRLATPITSSAYNPNTGQVFYTTEEGLYTVATRSSPAQRIFELHQGEGYGIIGLDHDEKKIYLYKKGGVYAYPLK